MLHDLKLEPKIVQDGIVELGSPVGTPDFEHAFLQKSVQDILSVLPLLVEMVNDEKVRHANKMDQHKNHIVNLYLPARQVAFHLLRFISTCSINFLSRTNSPAVMNDCCKLLDVSIKSTFSQLCDMTNIDDNAWLQATLPISPGLGFVPSSFTTSLAFSAAAFTFFSSNLYILLPYFDHKSFLSSSSSLAFAFNKALSLCSSFVKDHPDLSAGATQHNLASAANKIRLTALFANSSPVDRHRLQSLSKPHSCSLFQAYPTNPHLCIPSHLFSYVVHLFLNTTFPFPQAYHCICSPEQLLDDHGEHYRLCKKGAAMIVHDHCSNVLQSIARLGGSIVSGPHSLLGTCPDDSNRRADFLIQSQSANRAGTMVDIQIINSCSPSHLSPSSSSNNANSALEYAANAKISKHRAAAANMNVSFVPFIVDYYGCFHEQASSLFASLIANLDSSHFPAVNFTARTPASYWSQVFSVTLWTGHASSIHQLRLKCLNRKD